MHPSSPVHYPAIDHDGVERPVKGREHASGGSGLLKALQLSWVYTFADIRRRPRNVLIGTVAVVLLVFFSAVLITEVQKAPYILLHLAELTVGEVDVLILGSDEMPLLNYTKVNQSLGAAPVVDAAAPRWTIRANMSSVADKRREASTPGAVNSVPRIVLSNVLVIDSELEKQSNIGRRWPHREIGFAEVHISRLSADYIGVSPNKGQRVALDVSAAFVSGLLGKDPFSLTLTRPAQVTDALSFYQTAFFVLNNIEGDTIDIMQVGSLNVEVTVADAVDSAGGKYPSVFGNVVVMDSRELVQVFLDQSCLAGPELIGLSPGLHFPTIPELLGISLPGISSFNINDYAMMVVVILEGRYDMYYSDSKRRGQVLNVKSNEMMTTLGLDFEGRVTYPVETMIETMDMFRVLVTSAFVTLVVGVIVLGAIVLFTLLQINAEERQFELAMMRAQGMVHKQIIGILVIQTLTFTVPGAAIGLSLAFAVNAAFEAVLARLTKAPPRLTAMSTVAIIISVTMGFLMPLLATYGPVKRALSSTLRDALDVYRQTYNEVHVRMIRLEEMGLSISQVLIGLFLVLVGFTVYYLVPMSLIFSDTMMFFILFDLVLISMIAGLCMMTHVLQKPMELLVLYLLLWGRETRLWTLIQKNLHSHRERNTKAYMMFLISVACVVGSGIIFSMLATVSTQLTQLTNGAQVTVVSSTFSVPLNQKLIDAFMETEGKRYATHWAYTSFQLSEYPQISRSTQVGNIVSTFRNIGVRAVTASFMDSTYSDYNIVNRYSDGYNLPLNSFGHRDVIRSMYEDPPRRTIGNVEGLFVSGFPQGTRPPDLSLKQSYLIPMIISSAAEDGMGLSVNAAAQLRFSYTLMDSRKIPTTFYVEPRAFMNRISGFLTISSLPLFLSAGSIFIPSNNFLDLLNPVTFDFEEGDNIFISETAILEVYQEKLYVRLREGLTKSERGIFVNSLQMYTDSVAHTTTDTEETLEQLKTVENMIMLLLVFSSIICVILCAFMMWVTFIANVELNLWTFGVLRSLGFRTAQLLRSTIYEALCIVVSAFIFGVAVGIIVGIVMSLVVSQILVIPLKIIFPYTFTVTLFGIALVAAVIGPIASFLRIRKKTIASILRGS